MEDVDDQAPVWPSVLRVLSMSGWVAKQAKERNVNTGLAPERTQTIGSLCAWGLVSVLPVYLSLVPGSSTHLVSVLS